MKSTRYSLLVSRYAQLVAVQLLLCVSFTRAQLTHLDSALAKSVAGAVSGLDPAGVDMAGDSSLLPLIRLQPVVSNSAPTLYIDQLSATVETLDAVNSIQIIMHGSLVRAGNPVVELHSWNFQSPVVLIPTDRHALETDSDRYVQWEAGRQSFWSRTLEPALVILGAAVIVALFFLLRS
ncbi:MAG TPA: hypothetical protein VG537_10310 [Candidatus Kapabacteria bacterium]|nr:hypothetical protein [Candidatus Kapabacteria bacterium]